MWIFQWFVFIFGNGKYCYFVFFIEIEVGWVYEVVNVFDKQNIVIVQWQMWCGVGNYLCVKMAVFIGVYLNCWCVGSVNVCGIVYGLLVVFNNCVWNVVFQVYQGFCQQGGFIGIRVGNQVEYQLFVGSKVCVVVFSQMVIFVQYVNFDFQYLMLVYVWCVSVCFVMIVMQVVFFSLVGGKFRCFNVGDFYFWVCCWGKWCVMKCGMRVMFIIFDIQVVFIVIVCCIYCLFLVYFYLLNL